MLCEFGMGSTCQAEVVEDTLSTEIETTESDEKHISNVTNSHRDAHETLQDNGRTSIQL